MNSNHKKGSLQHKIFKVIILVIVAVFFYLIYSFVKIEFFKRNSQSDYSLELNSEKFDYLEKLDRLFLYSKNKKYVDDCNLEEFYTQNLVVHKPCVIKKSESTDIYLKNINQILVENKLDSKPSNIKTVENSINLKGLVGKIGFLEFMEYLEYDNLYLRFGSEINNNLSNSSATNKHLVLIQLDQAMEIRLSPITQIKKYNSHRNIIDLNLLKFNSIEITDDLFSFDDKDSETIILKIKLNKGDIIYIPPYFFVQEKHSKENDVSLRFEFKSNSRLLDTLFKVLYDDTTKFQEGTDNF